MTIPKIIILISGKRKSGKDYICGKITSDLGDICTIIRISGPLKQLYAKNYNLNFDELLTDGPYKEQYRLDMIKWSDKIRESQPGFFCKAACDMAQIRPVWIISDIRRKTDIEWFKDNFNHKVKCVRIEASLKTREKRGWVYTKGVDDVVSECNLDDFQNWDLQVKNNDDNECKDGIVEILSVIRTFL